MKMLLVVDDNAEMRRLLKTMLERIVDEIHEASNGDEAVALYRAQHPDFVVMDVHMNPTDGLTAAGEIRNLDSTARIVFISNHTDSRTRQAIQDAGGEAFFGKHDLMSLVEYLEKV